MNAAREVGALTVLLIEDHEADVVLTTEAFEEARVAVDLVVAKDGAAALAMLEEAARGRQPMPGLILLDLNLPKVDGLTVLEHVKSEDELKAIPVIVMSSSPSPTDLRGAYERHANSFIRKPLDPAEFLEKVRGIEHYWLTVVRLPGRE